MFHHYHNTTGSKKYKRTKGEKYFNFFVQQRYSAAQMFKLGKFSQN